MFIPDSEKDDRKAALQKLMGMMNESTGKKLSDLKKPMATSMTIEKVDPLDKGDDDEMGSDADDSSDEPSDDEKMMISKLYHKYC